MVSLNSYLTKKEGYMWTKRYMLRAIAHCKEGCSTVSSRRMSLHGEIHRDPEDDLL